MDLIEGGISPLSYNPIDQFEALVGGFEWPFRRASDNEIDLTVAGTWCDYHVSITWQPELEALHLTSALDVKVGPDKVREIHSLMALVNEQLWFGHFDLWSEDHVLIYRYGFPLNGGAMATVEQCESLLQMAVDSCERYYSAFQFVLWAGKTAEEAVASAMFETQGTA